MGVLSLDTAFPRILGDVGNPDSYPFDVIVRVVDGADSVDIVQDDRPSEGLMQRFVAAAVDLEREGVAAIVSTCGFLISAQKQVSEAVRTPVMLSALSLYHTVQVACPGKIGILTASCAALGPQILAAAGVDAERIAVAGLDRTPLFAETFLLPRAQQATAFNRDEMEGAVLAALQDLTATEPDLSALILECGNLPPYADAIRRHSGLPVFHLVDAAIGLVAAGEPDRDPR